MKALYTTAPGHYGLTERPVPDLAVDEALIRVAGVGLCSNEVRLRDGVLKIARYPVVPGHQFAGVVESCGPYVESLEPGDRVAVHPYMVCGQCAVCRSNGPTHDCERFEMLGMSLDGGLAEYCAAPARHLYKLPENVTLDEGALVENIANAIAMIRNAGLQTGERVVVIGAWSVALLAVQVARQYSPAVLALAGSGKKRLEPGSFFGATHVIDLDEKDVRERLETALGTQGADAVLVCGDTSADLELAIEVVATQGRIVVEGHFDPAATITLSPSDLLVARSVTLRGNRGFMTPDYTRAHQMLADGVVEVKSLITYRFPLEDWEAAFDRFTDPAQQTAQVLIVP